MSRESLLLSLNLIRDSRNFVDLLLELLEDLHTIFFDLQGQLLRVIIDILRFFNAHTEPLLQIIKVFGNIGDLEGIRLNVVIQLLNMSLNVQRLIFNWQNLWFYFRWEPLLITFHLIKLICLPGDLGNDKLQLLYLPLHMIMFHPLIIGTPNDRILPNLHRFHLLLYNLPDPILKLKPLHLWCFPCHQREHFLIKINLLRRALLEHLLFILLNPLENAYILLCLFYLVYLVLQFLLFLRKFISLIKATICVKRVIYHLIEMNLDWLHF